MRKDAKLFERARALDVLAGTQSQTVMDPQRPARDAKQIRALKRALKNLLNYTGGWDITDKRHPIYKARVVLKRYE